MHELIIVGGGPIGLYAAILANKKGIKGLLFESSEVLGGQLMELYPEKEIVDIPEIPMTTAKDYIDHLIMQVNKVKDGIVIHTQEKVLGIASRKTGIEIKTTKDTYLTKTVIIATGLGVYVPRKMGLPDEDKYSNILYSLKSVNHLRDKRVVIMGGGDSALDWAKMSSRVTKHVTIVHRRNEFRGDYKTIQEISTITVKTPFIPVTLAVEGSIVTALELENVATSEHEWIKGDFFFVNYGHIPMSDFFGLERLGIGAKVDEKMMTSLPGVFAIGDVAGYQGKLKRLAPGLTEAKIAINEIIKRIK
ncbi:MAG: NAD(P)/FAD-dependent oxidoreductase [Firmicutes bacterium]|nr:NAD(P)/FAD-dependent oxidoreductase [Bacillota bacterium]